jgi:hypothetical protein
MTKKLSGIGHKMADVYFEVTHQDGKKSTISNEVKENKPDQKKSKKP